MDNNTTTNTVVEENTTKTAVVEQTKKEDQSVQNNQISQDNTIKYGDQVIFYESVNSMKLQTITRGGSFQNRFGYFGHQEVVGQQFGSKLFNLKKNAFIYLLRPDPVLITDTLSHKTQILYQADISFVIAKMNILPGSVVVESGTGSASLSSSIAKTVQDEGHLYTFEFNELRAKNGAEVLSSQGLKNFDVIWRDVLGNGFLPIPGEQVYGLTEGSADAVFLDLPTPFEAIAHAKKVLKRGGRLCCFSPCIEQVMKNCEEMRAQKFIQISTIEIIQRPFERRERTFQSAFSIINPDEANINAKRTLSQLQESDENKNVNQEENFENQDQEDDNDYEENNESGDEGEDNAKKGKNAKKNKKGQQQNQDKGDKPNSALPPKMIKPTITKILYSSGPKEIKGHTGYLSFAILM